MNEELKTCVTY